MFNAFSESEEAQIVGFINYIKNYDDGSLLEDLRNEDYVAFGIGYNDSALYGMEDNIQKYKDAK